HTLTVIASGRGTVAKSPDQGSYDHGASVQLTATPDSGFAFSGWSGDASGTDNPLTLVMDANKSVTATFVDVAPPAVQVLAANGGEVWSVGTSVDFQWSAVDNDSVTLVDVFLSRSGAAGPFESIAAGLANSGLYSWTVTGPPTDSALVKVVAHDGAGNPGEDASDSLFAIADPTAVAAERLTGVSLSRPEPNPTSSGVHFTFGLPRAA